jgi:hypothetical protein
LQVYEAINPKGVLAAVGGREEIDRDLISRLMRLTDIFELKKKY